MAEQPAASRGLTLRAVVAALTAMFLMGVWIEYIERFCSPAGQLAENFPPHAAVGVILAVMGVGSLLYFLRRPLRLTTPELTVVYIALVLAAPLMSQGMWGRLFGLVAAIPKNQDFKSYDSLPAMLWPHGPNLVRNGRFTQELEGFRHEGGGALSWTNVDRRARGVWRSPVLSNAGDTNARATLVLTLDRFDRGREMLVPGERFLFAALLKLDDAQRDTVYFVELQADDGPSRRIFASASATRPTFANPCGFQRVGVSPLALPPELETSLSLRLGLEGPGRLTLQDIQLLSIEAVEGLYSGRRLATDTTLPTLVSGERDFLAVRPDNMWSWRGVQFLLAGYIPMRDWLTPMAAWSLIVAALFAAFLGLNILMRKQWAENERFAFPQTILPRHLLAESAGGGPGGALFRNRIMWLGFAITLPLVILRGLHFYNPGIPAPIITGGGGTFDQFFINPLAKAFFQNVGMDPGATGAGFSFSLLAIALLIDTNVLFSLWVSFFLFQLWNLFGKAFNFTRFPGYPWKFQQSMGAFIGFALLALFVARRHLAWVWRVISQRATPAPPADERRAYRLALLLVAAALVAIAAWGVWTGMGLTAALLFFGYLLLVGFAAAKVRAECGAPFSYLTPYYGMQFVAAIGGFALFGSTGMLVATIASGFMTTASFLLMSPTQVEMMELGRQLQLRRQDVWSGLALGLLGALVIGGFVLLCWAYGLGVNQLETTWPYEQFHFFNQFRAGESAADRACAQGILTATPSTRPLDVIHNLDAKGLGLGLGITWLLALLRSLFMWFPLHPIGYVLAPSHFMGGFWFCAFLAWAVRMLLLRIGGARSIRAGLVPFCLGMFLACVTSMIIFTLAGVVLRCQGVTNIYSAMP